MNVTRPLSVLAMFMLAGCQEEPTPVVVATQPQAQPQVAQPQPQPKQQVAGATTTETGRQTVWDVRTFRCDQLLGLADDDRAAAAMFYYGYLASAANMTVIDTSRIEGNIRRVMDQCAKSPNSTVPDAFRQALAPPR